MLPSGFPEVGRAGRRESLAFLHAIEDDHHREYGLGKNHEGRLDEGPVSGGAGITE